MNPAHRHQRAARITLAALAALLLLCGCGSAARTPTRTHLLTRTEIIAEYHTESAKLTLPPGSIWPSIPQQIATDPADYRYEAGVGQQGAQFWWYCSWAKHGISRDDPVALARLNQVKTMSLWSHIDDTGKAMFNEISTQIGAGNLGPLKDYLTSNCIES